MTEAPKFFVASRPIHRFIKAGSYSDERGSHFLDYKNAETDDTLYALAECTIYLELGPDMVDDIDDYLVTIALRKKDEDEASDQS